MPDLALLYRQDSILYEQWLRSPTSTVTAGFAGNDKQGGAARHLFPLRRLLSLNLAKQTIVRLSGKIVSFLFFTSIALLLCGLFILPFWLSDVMLSLSLVYILTVLRGVIFTAVLFVVSLAIFYRA